MTKFCVIIRGRFFMLFFFVFSSFFGFSEMEKRLIVNVQSRSYRQQLIAIDSITHGIISAEMFYHLPAINDGTGSLYDFTFLDSVIFLTKRCDFRVWKWSETEGWQNLYSQQNRGWCMSNRYIRNNELLGFTAKGFWTSQSGLYVFDKTLGNWDLLDVRNSPKTYVSSGDFKIGKDTIVSVFGKKVELGQSYESEMLEGYGLNLKTHTWFRVESKIELKAKMNTLLGGIVFDFENSVLIIKGESSLFIEKKSKKVFYRPIEYIDDNKIEFCYNDCMKALIIHGGMQKVIIPRLEKDAKYMGEICFTDIENISDIDSFTAAMRFPWFWGGSLLLVLGFVLGLFLMTTKKLKKRTLGSHNHTDLIKKLIQENDVLLATHELDNLLVISGDLNADSRRVKRSRIIHEVNSEYQLMAGKKLITRERDPKDKRYMLYRIKK